MKNYEIEIQRHSKISDFIGYNDMIAKTEAEKQIATKLYKTIVLQKEINGLNAVYVYATDLNDNFIGGLIYVNNDLRDYSHSEIQHKDILKMFK